MTQPKYKLAGTPQGGAAALAASIRTLIRSHTRRRGESVTRPATSYRSEGGSSSGAGVSGGGAPGSGADPLAQYLALLTIDQSGGTPGTYGALVGAVNGTNDTFTASAGAYVSGTGLVWHRGQIRQQGTGGNQWAELSPSAGTIQFVTPPKTGDEIIFMYRRPVT